MNSRTICLFVLVLAVAGTIWADNENGMRDLLTKESYYRCSDYALNASMLIPRLYDEGKVDSVKQVIDFWEEECGLNNRIIRTKILIALYDHNFNENMYERWIISHLVDTREMIQWINEHDYFEGKSGYSPNEVDRAYDKFIRDFARKLQAEYTNESVEYLFTLFYTNEFDAFFDELRKPAFGRTKLQMYYLEEIDELISDRGKQTCYSASIDRLYPTGQLEYLGDHTGFTMSVGDKFGGFQGDVTFGAWFGGSGGYYHVVEKGVLDSTDSSPIFYFGLDGSWELSKIGPFHLNLLTGLGWSGMHTVDDPNEDKRVVLSSLNWNAGLGTRFYVNKYRTWYMELKLKYNVANFDSKAGTDLSGNFATLSVAIGYLTLGDANKALKLLGFFD